MPTPDGVRAEDEALLTSLAQFDALSNVVAAADRPNLDFGHTFYPNFSRFRQDRVQGIVGTLLTDTSMRAALGVTDDEALASALNAVGTVASSDGARFLEGFQGWAHTSLAVFIDAHPRGESPS